MPYIATDPATSHPRIPAGVDDGEEVRCPECSGVLRVRGGGTVVRHFYHPPESSCEGESASHLAMKSIAVDKLKSEYPDASIHIEFTTETPPRRADVFVEFQPPIFPLGKGIAVEVQHKNTAKDITETTADYLAGNYSVIWLFEDDYEGDYPKYNDVELPDPMPVWPNSVPHGDEDSSEQSVAASLGLSESDLLGVLPDQIEGQSSLNSFQIDDGDQKEKSLPKWSLKRSINLQLSIQSDGVQEVYQSWLRGQLTNVEDDVRSHVDGRKEDRKHFFGRRFNKGTGHSFELSLGLHPDSSSHYSKRNDECIIRQFVGSETHELRSSINERFATEFTGFVTQICYELETSHFATSTDNGVWVNTSQRRFGSFKYSISHPEQDRITVNVERAGEAVSLQFHPNYREELLALCAKLRLWYRSHR